MNKINVDTSEICIQYKLAKNKKKQIKILSELMLVSKEEIKRILINNGYTIAESKSKEIV